ncbi:MAG: hypothetical protein JRM99_01955 [Nitrososphaerota archaeon]|nr:hypothetical protein [Nitrososphaerota archaeon]
MGEDADPAVSIIEAQEEFIQHMEKGGRKITVLAVIATLAGGYFAVSYFVQLVILPYVLGVTTQTVDLLDPGLMVAGAVSLAVSLLWLYAGLRDLTFGRRMAKQIKAIRVLQSAAAKKYGLGPDTAEKGP